MPPTRTAVVYEVSVELQGRLRGVCQNRNRNKKDLKIWIYQKCAEIELPNLSSYVFSGNLTHFFWHNQVSDIYEGRAKKV